MADATPLNLDAETIGQLGLRQSDAHINAPLAPNARVFVYPAVADVYVMESDLYGNAMPQGSVFLAFEGRSGLVGKHIRIDVLKKSSIEEIRKIVADNNAG